MFSACGIKDTCIASHHVPLHAVAALPRWESLPIRCNSGQTDDRQKKNSTKAPLTSDRGSTRPTNKNKSALRAPATRLHAFPGTTHPWLRGSSRTLSQPPNPRGRERSFCPTNFAKKPAEHGFQHCAHAIQKKKKKCLRSVHESTSLSQPGSSGQPHLHMYT